MVYDIITNSKTYHKATPSVLQAFAAETSYFYVIKEIIQLKSKKFISIRYKFSIFFIAIFIPIVILSIVSYNKLFNIIEEKISTSNYISIKQTGSNIEFILNDIQQLSLDLYQSTILQEALSSPPDQQKMRINRAEQWLKYVISSNEYIYSIYINNLNGVVLNPESTNEYIDPDIQQKILSLKGMYLWNFGKVDSHINQAIPVLSISRLLKDVNDITHDLGILKINIDENKIMNIYKNNLIDPDGNFFLINDKNEVISALDKSRLYTPLETEVFSRITKSRHKSGYFDTLIQGSKTLVTYYKIDRTSWVLVNYVPLDNLLHSSREVSSQILLAIILSFVVFLILTLAFIHKLLNPLEEVRRVMVELPNKNFDVRLHIKGNDEISLLGRSFNQMSEKLNELMNQVYFVKIKQKEAELKALQAQINPHFLYNTLDTIYWMSTMENAHETSTLVKALAKLFRLSLNQGSPFTTVEKEIEHLKNYILIQKKRYEETIEFEIAVDEQVSNCKVIKLILQPLIENAIYHGIEPKGDIGRIKVSIFQHNDFLYYKIQDDGVGVDENKIQEFLEISHTTEKSHGFALNNVNDRIKLYFGNEFGIEFHSIIDKGTTVLVKQPILKGDQSHD